MGDRQTFGWKIPLSSLLAFVCFDLFFFFVGFWPVFETRHLNTVGNFCPYSITRECMTLSHKTPRNRAHTRINDICVLEFIRACYPNYISNCSIRLFKRYARDFLPIRIFVIDTLKTLASSIFLNQARWPIFFIVFFEIITDIGREHYRKV